MSGAESTTSRKQAYFAKLVKLLDEYPKIFIVGADNVGSNQMQKIRRALRGKGEVLMGKNTMIRKAIRGHLANNPALEILLPQIRGNIGFVFTKDDLSVVRKVLTEQKVAAPAKAGSLAPVDVIVPAGPTGLEPTQTGFLQALNIQSKIVKGQIEIVADVHLISKGQKVGTSESTLLQKLDIKPFQYGLVLKMVYDNGSLFDPKVLDLTDEDLLSKFAKGVQNIAAIGLAIGYPTVASLPHSLTRGYKNVLSISLATDYSIKQAEKLKEYLANPNAFAVSKPAETKKEESKPAKTEEKKPAKETKPEPEEEETEMVGGLFGDF
jgi:large subunit ribosomal protein LP0